MTPANQPVPVVFFHYNPTPALAPCECCGEYTTRRVRGLPVCGAYDGECELSLEDEFGPEWHRVVAQE